MKQALNAHTGSPEKGRASAYRSSDFIVAVASLIVGVAYLVSVVAIDVPDIGNPTSPRSFPMLLGGGLVAVGLALLMKSWRGTSSGETSGAATEEASPGQLKTMLLFVILPTAAYGYAIPYVGFLVSTAAYLLLLLFKFRPGRPVTNILIGLLASLAIGYAFAMLLRVPLPLFPTF